MRIRKALGLAAAFLLVIGVVGCVSLKLISNARADQVRQEARAALARWDSVVASGAGGSGFVLVGEKTLMVGDDWGPSLDGGNAKLAWYSGMFDLATTLPTDTPPEAEVHWTDGMSRTVPVISAGRAFTDLKGAAVQSCPDCTPLVVTSAKLTTATFDTSRGKAEAPAWEFSLENTDVKLDEVAVAGELTLPAATPATDPTTGSRGPWVGPAVDSATIDSSGMVLTVNFAGSPETGDRPCGADYSAEAVESDSGVVVIVFEHRNPLPVPCTAVAAFRSAQVRLAKPLGSRVLIGLDARPISVSPAG